MSSPAPVRIDGQTKVLGLLGEHISYTRSPAMHNRAAELLGRNEVYLPLSMPAADVGDFLRIAWSMGAAGFNVTTPHKELVASLFPASGLASANTLYRGKAGWLAASTDGEGFALGLARLGRPLDTFRRIVLLGSGGASLALLAYMGAVLAKVPELYILRRNAQRDAALSAVAPCKPQFLPWSADALRSALQASSANCLLIQASSAPQRGDDLAGFVTALSGFTGTLSDLVYGKPSALYREAVSMGLPAQDGQAMLIEQARLSQQLWWGQAAAYDAMAATFTP